MGKALTGRNGRKKVKWGIKEKGDQGEMKGKEGERERERDGRRRGGVWGVS